MTDIEAKALALVNEVAAEKGGEAFDWWYGWRDLSIETEALCRAIEAHEAFRQEVSDAVEQYWASISGAYVTKPPPYMARFIIAKPDPLVEFVDEVARDLHITGASTLHTFRSDDFRKALRAAIEARGGKIGGEG